MSDAKFECVTTSAPSQPEVTDLLARWADGDRVALDELAPLVYDHLRGLSHVYFARERRNHTLQPTDLLHDVYLELTEQRGLEFANRSEFFGLVACLMRRALVDYSRKRAAKKRAGDRQRVPFDEALTVAVPTPEALLALDDALASLAKIDAQKAPQKARIVELRYFGGLTVSEAAACLGISARTAAREWKLAKALLFRHLTR
ncbi:MAG: ECF-type sigma factor [Acidobacteriota bacterium]